MTIESLAKQGRHSIYLSMAESVKNKVYDIRKEHIQESLSDFHSVEHRLEYVTTIHGIEFINDSKATNLNATWYALECMTKGVVWIIGTPNKEVDYTMFRQLVKEKVKAIICLGSHSAPIVEAFQKYVSTIVQTDSMADAVKQSYFLGDQGDAVLLSPGCSSFDMFEDYEDRGRQFKSLVREL